MTAFKRVFCILLVLCLAFAAGCADTGESSATSPDGESTSEPVSEPAGSSSTEYTQRIDSLLSSNGDRTLSSSNLLRGLKYTVSRTTSPDYPDDGTLLTDGNEPGSFQKDVWAGFYSSEREDLTVDFDLTKEYDGIMDFHADILHLTDYGINACKKMTVSVAGEDKVFTSVGIAYPPSDIGSNDAWDFSVLLAGEVKARYIRFGFSGVASVWLFIGELSVTAYGSQYEGEPSDGSVSSSDYYGSSEIPVIETPEYWADTESDYNKKINLVSGKKAIVSASESIASELATEWYNSRTLGQLSDGLLAAQASYSDSRWFHITRGGTRNIVFDLGKTSTVNGFSVGFLRDSSVGVNLPRYVSVAVSENGKDWQTLYTLASVTSTSENAIVRLEESFSGLHKARYVRLSFAVNVHCYIDEFSVTGTKKLQSSALDVVPDENGSEGIFKNDYIYPENFCGVNNMLLSYNCLVDGSNNMTENGLITEDEYLPYVAYLDSDGNIKDTFFDSFLYLPYTAFNYNDYGRSAAGWRTYLENIYTPDRNMDALDSCVAKTAGALSLTGYKAKVFTPIFYTFKTLDSGAVNPFGDIDGDGKDEDFTRISDRKKAIKWIMDEEVKRFGEGNYSNLEFCGFYWFEESITYSDPDETELIRFASDYAHKLGMKLFWIPYQQASGYSDWKELGFDLACMQPNYMFNNNYTGDILYSNAATTKLYGMCVEMEINDPTNRQDASRYTEYIIAGAQTGYMKAVKMYYQSGVPGAFYSACMSKDASVRKIYDDTYLYAKEKYVVEDVSDVAVSVDPITVSGGVGAEIKGSFDLTNINGGKLKLAVSPKYGSVMLNLDGSFVYYSPAGYKGSDSFAVCVDFGYDCGKNTLVEITIG